MKRYATSFLLLTFCGAVLAQSGYNRVHSKMLDEAKGLFLNEQWVDAAKVYKRLLDVDTTFGDVPYELAICLGHMPGKREQTAALLERAERHGHIEAGYELAMLRHRQERFDEEVALLTSYRSKQGRAIEDAEVSRKITTANNAKELLAFPVEMNIRNMGQLINSSAHDYCPLVTADGATMYFTSRREGSTGGMRDPSGQWFEDIYMARHIDEMWSNAMPAGRPLNTELQDATVGLSPDGNEMIIYRTSMSLESGDLFSVRRMQGLWTTPEKLTSRINSEFHEPSATISPDGSEVYFTSDRDGGFGGRDLYRIRRLPNGEWSLPLNLGPMINTAQDEDAPFLHSDGTTLFFSSNGHNTMGGYDIFKSNLIDYDMNGWSAPENMGAPLNTVNDDIYFCLSADGQTGYFSSEREGGMGGQDIYRVEFPTSQIDYLVVRGVITDVNEEPIKGHITLMKDGSEELVGIYNANDRTGRYLMVVEPRTQYTMTVEAAGFETRVNHVNTTVVADGTREIPLDVTLVRNEHTAGNTKP